MNLINLLKGEGHEIVGAGEASGTKVMRHTFGGNVVVEHQLRHNREFLQAYQEQQASDIFRNCKLMLTFVGDGPYRALYKGAWRLRGKLTLQEYLATRVEAKAVQDLDAVNAPFEGYSWYDTEFDPSVLGAMVDRLVIDFGRGMGFHKWLNTSMQVIEVFPEGYAGSFEGYQDFFLTYAELRRLIANPAPNRSWRQHLSSVHGIYLILDTLTGLQYVGSAYGADGIWGRWSEYARDPSGGNVMLSELIKANGPGYADNFQFSILRVLERSATKAMVVQAETREKIKHGTRSFGLSKT